MFTPVIKAFFTDYGFESCNLCQQVFGGHGYISEWGMEQLVRDARISQIYEGANGIHALDLTARKIPMNGGRAIRTYMQAVSTFVAERRGKPELEEFAAELRDRFGVPPPQADRLLDSHMLRLLGREIGIQRILVRGRSARLTFRDDVVPRLTVLEGPLRDRLIAVEVHRMSPLSLVLRQEGADPLTRTLIRALDRLSSDRARAA